MIDFQCATNRNTTDQITVRNIDLVLFTISLEITINYNNNLCLWIGELTTKFCYNIHFANNKNSDESLKST